MKILIGAVVALLFPVAAWAGDFTDNQNGTVTDKVTGLMWQQQDDNTTRTWEAAISYCEDLSLATHGDWRLPSSQEIASMVDRSHSSPAVDSLIFTNMKSSFYWSSTTYKFVTTSAWGMSFTDGSVSFTPKTGLKYALCVRTAIAGDHAPVANAGPEQHVATGVETILDGSRSADADGDPLTYRWSLISVPGGSSVALTGADTVGPTLIPDVDGVYEVRLVVNDGTISVADTVTITATTP